MTDTRYYIQVYGPRTTGAFGCDSYTIEKPSVVDETAGGSLIFTTVARPAGRVPDGPYAGMHRRARGPQTIVYPRGEWTKVKIGKVERRG